MLKRENEENTSLGHQQKLKDVKNEEWGRW